MWDSVQCLLEVRLGALGSSWGVRTHICLRLFIIRPSSVSRSVSRGRFDFVCIVGRLYQPSVAANRSNAITGDNNNSETNKKQHQCVCFEVYMQCTRHGCAFQSRSLVYLLWQVVGGNAGSQARRPGMSGILRDSVACNEMFLLAHVFVMHKS